MSKPDFHSYTLEQLIQARADVDGDLYPENLAEIESLIRTRRESEGAKASAEADESVLRVTIADDQGRMASVKPGRMPSLGRGLSAILASIVGGWAFIRFPVHGDMPMGFIYAIASVGVVTGVIGGLYHIYNAFAPNRFSETDIVAPGTEQDPFDRLLARIERRVDRNAD